MKTRLEQSLNSGDSVKIPKGLSREQKRNFILTSEEGQSMIESLNTFDITFKGVEGNKPDDASIAYLTVSKVWLAAASDPESDAGKMLAKLKEQVAEFNSGRSDFIILPSDKDREEEKVTLSI